MNCLWNHHSSFSYYLENIQPHFITTNQAETCTTYGTRISKVDDQIECRQAFPVAVGSLVNVVTYRNLDRSLIFTNDQGDEDPNLPGGCHVMAKDTNNDNTLDTNHLEFNADLVGSSHPNAWEVCRSCKY